MTTTAILASVKIYSDHKQVKMLTLNTKFQQNAFIQCEGNACGQQNVDKDNVFSHTCLSSLNADAKKKILHKSFSL